MDFLGRAAAALTQLAKQSNTAANPVSLVAACAQRIPDSRPAYTWLKIVIAATHDPRPVEIALAQNASSPNDLLWTHLAHTLQQPPNRRSLDPLWSRAFAHQSPAGHLHPLTPDTLLDAFVYDELTALHAAYRSALRLRDPQKITQCRRIVEYHVANTQPDHTTAEPWALAAFAALDHTHTFAEQQLHDATTAATHQENPVILALLADAVLTMRDTVAYNG
jgi:hypothetical protein